MNTAHKGYERGCSRHRNMDKGVWEAMKQMVWHLPCCKHSGYFRYGVSLRKTLHNREKTAELDGVKKVAKKMREMGLSKSQIKEAIGLTDDEVNEL